jgi:hypothetical protein
MLRFGTIDDGETQVLLDEDDCAIFVEKRFGQTFVPVLDYRARNLRVLSEHFSDAVGYGPAVALLHSWHVPHNSPLWTLSHKGGTNHFTDR